jgi:hypothetical protein
VLHRRWLPSGQLVSETVWEHGRALLQTAWKREGTVYQQIRFTYDGHDPVIESRREPPWWPDAAGRPVADLVPPPASPEE